MRTPLPFWPSVPTLAALALGTTVAGGCRTADTPDLPTRPGPNDQRACTMEFRTYDVTLLDAAGRPVRGATVDVRRSDGSTIYCAAGEERGCLRPDVAAEPPSADPGGQTAPNHLIMTDGVRVAPAGETFTVNARAPGGQAVAATYRFRFDGCHVRKVAGADTLRLGS